MMSTKYRVKLKNERIVGPFPIEKIGEMFFKKIIDGSEECQVFPDGKWEPIETVSELSKLIVKIISQEINLGQQDVKESETVINLSIAAAHKELTAKMAHYRDEPSVQEEDETEENVLETKIKSGDKTGPFNEFNYKKSSGEKESNSSTKSNPSNSSDDKTVIINKKLATTKTADATRIVDLNYNPKEFFAKTMEKNGPAKIEILEEAEKTPEEEKINTREETKVANVKELLPELHREVELTEQEVEEEKKQQEEQEKKELNALLPPSNEGAPKGDKKKQKGIRPIAAIAFLAIFIVLLVPDEDTGIKTEGEPQYVEVSYPVALEINKIKSEEQYQSGVVEYQKGRYYNKLEAINYFQSSWQYNNENNYKAIGKLLLCYAELFRDAQDRDVAASTIYKIIKLVKGQALVDRDIALGSAIFFYHMKKYQTAFNIMENFDTHRIGVLKKIRDLEKEAEDGLIGESQLAAIDQQLKEEGLDEKEAVALSQKRDEIAKKLIELADAKKINENTVATFKKGAYHLLIALELGRLDRAREIAAKLDQGRQAAGVDAVPLEVYLGLAKFYRYDEKFEEGRALLVEASKKYKDFAIVWLDFAEYILREGNKEKLETLLSGIKIINYERSPYYYSRYLEYSGILMAMKGNNEGAVQYLQKSLKINPSDDLISKLAAIDIGGSKAVQEFLLETKARDLVRKSKEMMEMLEWEKAMMLAIEAVDLCPKDIDARLHMAKLQAKRGYFVESIETLQKLFSEYSASDNVRYTLIDTYIDAHQYDDAQKSLNQAGESKFFNTARYVSISAKYQEATGNIVAAVRNYREALYRDPLNEQDYYSLARIYLKQRAYDMAKIMLGNALELDPQNIDFHLLYARILFDKEKYDAPEVAIGYLRNLLESNPENPKLIGEIGKYYYQSGQMNEFEEYKKKFENLPKKDEEFYRFLVYATKLEEKTDEAIKYYDMLLKISPGDLEMRFELGEFCFSQGRTEDAELAFSEVKKRLPEYPLIYYYLAKIALQKGDVKKAHEMADMEIKINPSKEHGYYVKAMAYLADTVEERYTMAMRRLEEAVARNGNSPEVLIALGDMKYGQNYLDEAREYYVRAHKHNQENPELSRKLGMVYKDIGQGEIAINYFQVYLTLFPSAPDRPQIELLIKNLK